MNYRAPTSNRSASAPASTLYETPVFEPDKEERLEALATSGRGALRLAANARLRVEARAARLRRRAEAPAGAATESVAVAQPATATKPVTAPKPVAAAKPAATKPAAAKPAKPVAISKPAVAKPAPKTPGGPTPATLKKARSHHHARIVSRAQDPAQLAADERAWDSWSQGLDDTPLADGMAQLDEERSHAVRRVQRRLARASGARATVSRALDRWADKEVELGMRIEDSIPRWAKRS